MGISLKGILGSVAPLLAGALPGPLGAVARKAIASALGAGDSEAEIEKAIATANPETLLKLRAAEQQFKLDMEKVGIDFERLAAEDRASARAMQIHTKSKTPAVLAAVVVGGWLLLQTFLLLHVVPAENREIILRALGIFDSALMLVLGYYFGSSSSSRGKDETIRKLSE